MRKLLILGRCDFVIFSHSVSNSGHNKKGVPVKKRHVYGQLFLQSLLRRRNQKISTSAIEKSLYYLQQLYIKDKCRTRSDFWPGRIVAIGKIGGQK